MTDDKTEPAPSPEEPARPRSRVFHGEWPADEERPPELGFFDRARELGMLRSQQRERETEEERANGDVTSS